MGKGRALLVFMDKFQERQGRGSGMETPCSKKGFPFRCASPSPPSKAGLFAAAYLVVLNAAVIGLMGLALGGLDLLVGRGGLSILPFVRAGLI